MSEPEYEWNGMQVRRAPKGSWLYLSAYNDNFWLPLTTHTVQEAVAAELDKLYPMPRTVTLDNGETWELVGFRSADRSTWMDLKTSEGIVQPRGGMLDTLDRIQNGDDRRKETTDE